MEKVIELAGVPVKIRLRHSVYQPIFDRFSTQAEPVAEAYVTDDEMHRARMLYGGESTDAYLEYSEMCLKVSDALIPHGRIVFHGTAFIWKEKAWIFAAVSGTGKTTQYLWWKRIYGDEIQILNGDKPVLDVTDSGITVHPSPWNGKENMGRMVSAPLGGIIMLQKDEENSICRAETDLSAARLFTQLLFSRLNEQDVRMACSLEELVIKQTPIWMMHNRGDSESARMCHDTIEMEVYGCGI